MRRDEHKGAELIRSTEEEKQDQVAAVRAFQARNADRTAEALKRLQAVAASGGNVFAELMEAVKCARSARSRTRSTRWAAIPAQHVILES